MHRNHPQPSHPAEQQLEEDQHVSPTPFRPMQPREFSLGGNLQRYRTLSTSDGRQLLLPLTLPADVGSGSFAGSVSGGSIGAISSRHSRMESADSVGSGNAEKAHPHHVVDPYSGGRPHTIAGTSENLIQVEGEVGAPRPALTKRPSVNSLRNSFECSMRRIIEEEHTGTSISTSLESHKNMHDDNVDVSGEENEEELVSYSMLGVQRLQNLEQQQWQQPVGITALSATSIAPAVDSKRSQAPFSRESLDSMDSSNLSPAPLSPDKIIADVGNSSNLLLVYEDKEEEEEVAENCGNEVAVGTFNIREWPAGSSSVLSQSHLSKKRPAELGTAMIDGFISPRRKDITTTTPMTVSTMSPTDANPSAAAATATARFGRLLQECRDLTETCEEDSAETPSSTNKTSSSSGGIRTLLQIKANAAAAAASAAAEADASKPPVALLQREIDTSKDDTMKLLQVSNLTMDPALLYSMRSSQYTTDSHRDSYHGSMNFLSSKYGKQHSDLGSSTNAPHFEATKFPLKEDNSDSEEPSVRRSPTHTQKFSKSVISDLSLGVDLMYGDLADEERSRERWQGGDETASFNPSEYFITDLGKSARLGISVQKQRQLPEEENDKKKVVTEATHHPELVNEMDETNIHGRTSRPKEEEESPLRYSWLSYTTNGDNDDTSGMKSTPEKSIERLGDPGTKTSPLEDDELIIPKNTIETASNHSTELSEGGDGLLVGFGHRPKAVHNEDSSISSSDSSDSSSSGSGGSSSYGSRSHESGSSGSGSSGSGSSGSGSFSGESSTSSEESLSLPALARHGLHIPTSRRDSDLVSELSFGGASALMAVQPMRSPIPQAGNSQDREKNEVSVSTPSPVTMPGALNESSPEDLNQRITAGDANESQSSIDFRPTLLSPEQTRRAPHRDFSSRASSRSRDPKRASNMLEKLEELSESNASFLDDVSSIAEPNKAVLAFFSEPATSERSSSSTSQVGHEFEKGKGIVAKTSLTLGESGDQKLSVLAGNKYWNAQINLDEVSESNASFLDDVSSINEPNNTVRKFFAPSDSDSLASSRAPQKSQDEGKAASSIKSDSSKNDPSPFNNVLSSFPRPHTNTGQDESIKSSKKIHRSNSKSSSTLSKRKTNSNRSLSSGSYYSEIVARATAMKSSIAVDEPLSSESSISASTLSSHRQMQQSLGVGGGGQDAGTKTTESFRRIHKEGASSAALIAPTSTAVFASDNITNVDSQQQNMEQGSGESPLEHINHNMNDDVSSMSSVVSRARNMSRDVRGVDNMSASSRSSRLSARNSREGNAGKMMQPWLTSESLDLCDIAVKASKLEKSGSRAESNDVNVAKQSSLIGHLAFSRRSVKSGDNISFAKGGLYEDFPSKTSDNDDDFFRQPSSSLQLLPTNVEADSKKPWKTAPRETSVDRSSHCDSQASSPKFKHEYHVEFQQPFVERRSDGENRSDGSVELFESKLALKRMGLYDETSISDASEHKLPTMDETLISEFYIDEDCHLAIDEHPKEIEIENTDTRDDQNENASRSSLKYFAAAAQDITDLLRSSIISKQLSSCDASSSNYQSERSGKGIIEEMKSFQKSFALKMRSDSSPVGGEEDVIVDEDHYKKAASDVESSVDSEHHEWNDDLSEVKSAVGDISYIKSLDEESKESEHDINTMLRSFRKRGSSASGNPFDDSIASHIFQNDELVDKISVSSSTSPFSIKHANDENNARDDNLNGTTQKSLCCQRGGDCQKSKLCWIVVVVIVVVVVITSIVVGQFMKKPPEPELTPPSETKTSSPTPFLTPRPPNWIEVGGDLAGESSADEAGHSVSVSKDGSRVIVGARRNKKDGMKNRGAARIFQLDEGTGSHVPIWDIYGEALGDQCGFSVSMSRSGKRIAVGSIGSDKNGKNAGQVRIYEEDEIAKTWTLVHDIIGEQETTLFGTSVSLSQDGSSIAVGAPYHSEGADMTKNGQSYVYREVQESEWEQIGQPIYGASSNDLFGWPVSFLPNAQFVSVGSPMLEDSLGSGYQPDLFIAWSLDENLSKVCI